MSKVQQHHTIYHSLNPQALAHLNEYGFGKSSFNYLRDNFSGSNSSLIHELEDYHFECYDLGICCEIFNFLKRQDYRSWERTFLLLSFEWWRYPFRCWKVEWVGIHCYVVDMHWFVPFVGCKQNWHQICCCYNAAVQ